MKIDKNFKSFIKKYIRQSRYFIICNNDNSNNYDNNKNNNKRSSRSKISVSI